MLPATFSANTMLAVSSVTLSVQPYPVRMPLVMLQGQATALQVLVEILTKQRYTIPMPPVMLLEMNGVVDLLVFRIQGRSTIDVLRRVILRQQEWLMLLEEELLVDSSQ